MKQIVDFMKPFINGRDANHAPVLAQDRSLNKLS